MLKIIAAFCEYFEPIKLPDNKTIIILDASGTSEFYEEMLKRNVITYGSDYHIEQPARVIQFLDQPFYLSSLLEKDYKGNQIPPQRPKRQGLYYKVLELIKTIQYKHKGMKVVIGTMWNLEMKLVANEVARENDSNVDECNATDENEVKTKLKADIEHYYDVRGINDYENHDVLIILGIPMLSYEVIANQARILFGQDWDDDVEVGKMIKRGRSWVIPNYCSEGGKGYELLTPKFTDKYIQQYYQHTVIAELYQMFGRIRPYKKGEEKYVYIITNTPIPNVRVDEMTTIKEFMELYGGPMERRREMRNILDAMELLPNKFTVKQLAYKLSELTGRDRTNKTQRQHIKKNADRNS